MYRALAKIILRVARKSHYPDVIAPELFKKRLRFIVHVPHHHDRRMRKVRAQLVHELPIDPVFERADVAEVRSRKAGDIGGGLGGAMLVERP